MRSFEGSGECSVLDFDRLRSSRLSAQEIRLDEVYVLMLAYDFGLLRPRCATRLITRIARRQPVADGGLAVNYLTLDEDFRTVDSFEAELVPDGAWAPQVYMDNGSAVVVEGYFRGYDDGFMPPTLSHDLQADLVV